MSTFGGVYFTNKGRALQAKALTGAQLNFTKLVVGDGNLTGQAIQDLTALIHEVKTLSITTLKNTNDGKVTIGGVLTNQGLSAGFYWRELGLFATDPDLGEILYCYGNAAALAEYIPAGGGADLLEKQINVVAIVGNASSVTATINQSLVYASAIELSDHESDIGAHGLSGKISHSLATAVNDFLVASAVGQYVKKTLAEVKTILGLGSAAYQNTSAFATSTQGTKADNAIPKSEKGVAGGVALYDDLASHSADSSTQLATGTANAITLAITTLTNLFTKTFIVSANNNGSATTINGKPLYKPNTTTAPSLTSGKAVTVWYNLASNCFFIKASAEGTALVGDVLAGVTFSNDNDTGLPGGLVLSGTAIAADIASGKTAYNTNAKALITGTNTKKYSINDAVLTTNIDTTYTIGSPISNIALGGSISKVITAVSSERDCTGNGDVYVGCTNGILAKVNAKTGATIWSVNLGANIVDIDVRFVSGIIYEVFVLVGGAVNKLFKISDTTGTTLYTSPTLSTSMNVMCGIFSSGKVMVFSESDALMTVYTNTLTLSAQTNIVTFMVGQSISNAAIYSAYGGGWAFDKYSRNKFAVSMQAYFSSQYNCVAYAISDVCGYTTIIGSMGSIYALGYVFDNRGDFCMYLGSYDATYKYRLNLYPYAGGAGSSAYVTAPIRFRVYSYAAYQFGSSAYLGQFNLAGGVPTNPTKRVIATPGYNNLDVLDYNNGNYILVYAVGTSLFITSFWGYQILG